MASFAQRAQAIGDALVNGTATAAQINHLGQALAHQAGMLGEYNNMTQGQRAEFVVSRIRSMNIGLVKQYDEYVAAQAARASAAAAVDVEFTETP